MNADLKNQIQNSENPFLRVFARTTDGRTPSQALRSLVLLDKGTGIVLSDDLRFDALNLAMEGTYRINVYGSELTGICGFATEAEVIELMKSAK